MPKIMKTEARRQESKVRMKNSEQPSLHYTLWSQYSSFLSATQIFICQLSTVN